MAGRFDCADEIDLHSHATSCAESSALTSAQCDQVVDGILR